MRLVVLVDKRPSLCFVFTIAHAVLRRMPSAFDCWSSLSVAASDQRFCNMLKPDRVIA